MTITIPVWLVVLALALGVVAASAQATVTFTARYFEKNRLDQAQVARNRADLSARMLTMHYRRND